MGSCYNNSVSTVCRKVQETESCLIGLNLHWKHAVNKAVRVRDLLNPVNTLLIAGLTNLISVAELEVRINYN